MNVTVDVDPREVLQEVETVYLIEELERRSKKGDPDAVMSADAQDAIRDAQRVRQWASMPRDPVPGRPVIA